MEVNIYINADHTGHLKHGTGTYGMVLEHIKDDKPVTRVYFNGVNNTTRNRVALLACIAALSKLNALCTEVSLSINSEYITQAINTNAWFEWLSSGTNAKRKPVKNKDLWQQLFDLVDKYHTVFIYDPKNSYTDWMLGEIKRQTIEYKEDTNNV